jgi:hypothetical protein
MKDLLPLVSSAEGLSVKARSSSSMLVSSAMSGIISFVGSEVLILLSGLGRSSEEARAGAHMVEKRTIQSIKDHEPMESSTSGSQCA